MRLRTLAACLLVGFLAAGDARAQTVAPLTVAGWSGAYGAAQERALFVPFTQETGIDIRIARHDGDLDPLSADPPPWDVVDLERAALTRACAEGRVMRLDPAQVLGAAAAQDFLPGTLHPCGIGHAVWSQAVAFDALAFEATPPQTLKDFFDLEAYPGGRGLFDGAQGTLEVALLADGVAPAELYDVLRRGNGVNRALAKLDTLRGSLHFWRDGADAERLLNDGTVTMTTAYAARFLRPRQGARRPAGLMFTNQLWRASYWAVPQGRADPAAAFRFISFATDAPRMAEMAARAWLGPARKSGLDAVPPGIRNDMLTARRHFHDAVQIDAGYWAEFGADAEAAFRAWRRR